MKIWRIGSKWDNEDIFPFFLNHHIAFAGSAVDKYISKVKQGDLIAITQGQQIIGLAKAVRLEKLKFYNLKYRSDEPDAPCIKLSDFYLKDEYPEIDFGLYNGQGKQFHEARNDYRKTIGKVFNKLNSLAMLNNLKELLEYKKQIILQGPPGTGKTYTAKQLAELFTKENVIDNPVSIIDKYFQERKQATAEEVASRLKLEGSLNAFQSEFPKDYIHSLSIDRYITGKGETNTFCWWIEYGLTELGGYSGQASKFKLFWKQSIDDYSKSGFIKDVQDDDQAMRMIAEQLQNVVNEQNLSEASANLSNGFILKILHSYYPDKYFPINKESCIDNALKLLGKNFNGLSVFEKNRLLQQTYLVKKTEFDADVTNYEFMRFLFGNFDMRGIISINNDQLVTKGECKLIQFHPAYTYEDFVRGITVQSNDNSQLEYITINKVLAQFAADAADNPTANYVLIIDEINRANLPAVLGELIYALEYRSKSVETMYEIDGNNKITLPNNLYIIGTMNTADRSVGHIDYAIRRRFAFKSVLPNQELVHDLCKGVFKKVSELFVDKYDDINWADPILAKSQHIAQDFNPEDVWIGHSYFMANETNPRNLENERKELQLKLEYEIKPLLREYVKDGILREDIKLENTADTLDYINKLSL
jgi:5-methylcytosine-specific restriction enzyme B